MKCNRVAF